MWSLASRLCLNRFQNVVISRSKPVTNLIVNRPFLTKHARKPLDFDVTDFKCIYYAKILPFAFVFRKFKYIQIVTVIGTQGAIIMGAYKGILSPAEIICISIIGLPLVVTLICTFLIPANVIGRIYVNKDKTKLVFSFVNMKLKRQDLMCDINEFKLQNHNNLIRRKFFKLITVKDTTLNFYHGKGVAVLDELRFNTLFPNII